MENCFVEIIKGEATEVQISAFITALKMKGETAEDIAAGSSVLRRLAVTIRDVTMLLILLALAVTVSAHGIFQQRLLLL